MPNQSLLMIIYTYWSNFGRARINNKGWRIDYFVISKELFKSVKNMIIHTDVKGSDHCPIELELK